MIKRSAAIVLTLLYLVTVTGFALNLHYCFSHIAAISINAPVKNCTNAPEKMKCCHNKHFEVKVKDAHQLQSVAAVKLFDAKLPLLPVAQLFLAVDPGLQVLHLYKDLPDPPPCSVSVILKSQTFRI